MKPIFLVFFGAFIFSCAKTEKAKTPEAPIQVVDSIIPLEKEVVQEDLIVFKVQIAALKMENAILANLESVSVSQENSLIKYRLGNFDNYKEARNYRKQVLKKYEGAFVQAIQNGAPISIMEALQK
jgi:hypothetical protein